MITLDHNDHVYFGNPTAPEKLDIQMQAFVRAGTTEGQAHEKAWALYGDATKTHLDGIAAGKAAKVAEEKARVVQWEKHQKLLAERKVEEERVKAARAEKVKAEHEAEAARRAKMNAKWTKMNANPAETARKIVESFENRVAQLIKENDGWQPVEGKLQESRGILSRTDEIFLSNIRRNWLNDPAHTEEKAYVLSEFERISDQAAKAEALRLVNLINKAKRAEEKHIINMYGQEKGMKKLAKLEAERKRGGEGDISTFLSFRSDKLWLIYHPEAYA